jgi:hypothetical protein
MKMTLVFGIFGFYLRDTILENIELALLFHRAIILSIIFDDQQYQMLFSSQLRLLG